MADVEYSDAIRRCDEGLLEEIDALDAACCARTALSAADDFIEGAITDCAVANIVWSTVMAYDIPKGVDGTRTTIADFFDLAKFPGKRGLRKSAKGERLKWR